MFRANAGVIQPSRHAMCLAYLTIFILKQVRHVAVQYAYLPHYQCRGVFICICPKPSGLNTDELD